MKCDSLHSLLSLQSSRKMNPTDNTDHPQLPTIKIHPPTSSAATPTPTAFGRRKIGVAVDLSEESAHAVRWAVQNYLIPGDAVVLLHVSPTSVLFGADWGPLPQTPPQNPEGTPPQSQKQLEDDFDAFRASKAADLAKPLKEDGIHYKIHIVKDDDMRERLCLEVERLGLSAVIMGSRGFGAEKRGSDGRLGSVSDYCVHHCVCPVIVVRYPDEKDGGNGVPVVAVKEAEVDEKDGKEGGDKIEGHSVPLGNEDYDDGDDEGAPFQPPSFQKLLVQFTPQLTFTPVLLQSSQSALKGKKNWDLIEDIALISAVMNSCMDATVGTNKKLRVKWSKVTMAYEQARAERPVEIPPRTLDMIKSRWGRIAPPVLKWAGCYDEAIRRKKSGQSEEDVLQEAHLIHQRKWGKFNLIEQWKILKKFKKWKKVAKSTDRSYRGRPPMLNDCGSAGSGSSGKRSRTNVGDVPDPDSPTSDPRPEGVKKAKSQMTGKMVADQAMTALGDFGESLRLTSEKRGERLDIEREWLEIQKQKEARKQKQLEMEEFRMKYDMYQQLSQKANHMPWEIELMTVLLNYFKSYKHQ